jgi:hypothetical protein
LENEVVAEFRLALTVAVAARVELGLGFWGDLWPVAIEEIVGAVVGRAVCGSGAAYAAGGRWAGPEGAELAGTGKEPMGHEEEVAVGEEDARENAGSRTRPIARCVAW